MSVLKRWYTSLNKRVKVQEEGFSLTDFVNSSALNVPLESIPFQHVVIDNFFKPHILEELTSAYNDIYAQGLSNDREETLRFHPFEKKINYDGYVYTPTPSLSGAFRLFFSVQWNLFLSKKFQKPTTLGTNMALHYHPKGDRTGWVHNDYATYFFPHKFILKNGVTNSKGEVGDVKLTPREASVAHFQQKRAIALIYYFNNSPWSEGDGGETGLYSSKNENSLFKKVAPINNRLLAFEVSPLSFHTFQLNLHERNSIVQWFHTDLEWTKEKYGFL